MTFYAINSYIGWGKGDTAEEAKENYYKTQVRNFAHVGKNDKERRAFIEENAKPVVYLAPEWATGFVSDGNALWTADDHEPERATADQVVENPYFPYTD